MGICQCDRYACERLSDLIYINGKYVCEKCVSEFLTTMKEANRNELTEIQFYKRFNKFMSTKPGNFHVKEKKVKNKMKLEIYFDFQK